MEHNSRLILFCGLLFTYLVSGQNLVINGSFEDHKDCPSNFTSIAAILDEVSTPTSSSGDYFNSCGDEEFGIPTNFKGEQPAAEGKAYLGLYFYALNDYREYVQLNTART